MKSRYLDRAIWKALSWSPTLHKNPAVTWIWRERESQIDFWPQYSWNVSRYASNFYHDALQKYALLWQKVTKIEHKLFFLKLFGRPRDIPAKFPGYPAKKFGFPGFRRTYRAFWPHPLTWKTPTPPEDIWTKKVWVWVPLDDRQITHRICVRLRHLLPLYPKLLPNQFKNDFVG